MMTGYNYPVFLFERGLALVNFVAFLSFYAQIALVLSKGVTPASDTMEKVTSKLKGASLLTKIHQHPSVFWFSHSDWFVKAVPITGMALSIASILGYYPQLCIPICMVLYNSCRMIGQPWLGLQMHATLVETDFLYTITAPFKTINPLAMVFAARFLTWRVMLGCGACKYSTGDKSWRDLTAMSKHYYTQPLPNPVSWYAHNMPMWFHKFSSIMTHVIEGPFTFLSFGNEIMRAIAFFGFLGLTMMINVTGNYGFLGLLTTAQSFSLLDDSFFFKMAEFLPFMDFLPPAEISTFHTSPLLMMLFTLISWAVVAPYLAVSLVPLVSTFYGVIPWKVEFVDYFTSTRFGIVNKLTEKVDGLWNTALQKIDNSPLLDRTWFRLWYYLERIDAQISPFSIVNRYAKFGSMSTYRWELVFEASDDGEKWTEYEFKYKPDAPDKRPAVMPFHLPGLDWRLWFLGPQLRRGGLRSMPKWFFTFMDALLEGRKDILKLLKGGAALRDTPPKYVRCLVYDYHFWGASGGKGAVEAEDKETSKVDEQGNRSPVPSRKRDNIIDNNAQKKDNIWWSRDLIASVYMKKATENVSKED